MDFWFYFFYSAAGIGASLWTHTQRTDGRMDGRTDVTLEIVF